MELKKKLNLSDLDEIMNSLPIEQQNNVRDLYNDIWQYMEIGYQDEAKEKFIEIEAIINKYNKT